MSDISATIIAKTDQLNADDLKEWGPIDIVVTRCIVKENGSEQPLWIHFDGDNGKPWKPNLSMRRVLKEIWGKESDAYPGRSARLFCNPDVAFGGLKVGGIRISHMSNISSETTVVIPVTRGKKIAYKVQPMPIPKATTAKGEPSPEQKAAAAKKKADEIISQIAQAETPAALTQLSKDNDEIMARLFANYPDEHARIISASTFKIESF